jgi:oligopeptide/dipeptide ABC transporter ATP-binding protein
MYLGRIVETGPATALLERPLHPYTQALVAAVPRMDRAARTLTSQLPGEPSSAIAESGCRFRNRCPLATNECAEVDPPLRPISDDAGAEHLVACINV